MSKKKRKANVKPLTLWHIHGSTGVSGESVTIEVESASREHAASVFRAKYPKGYVYSTYTTGKSTASQATPLPPYTNPFTEEVFVTLGRKPEQSTNLKKVD